MDQATTKAALIDWARRERAGWELLVAEVGEARMLLPGPMGDWTCRDLLAHLDAWQRFEQGPLEQALTGERPAPPWPAELEPTRDQDAINQSSTRRPAIAPSPTSCATRAAPGTAWRRRWRRCRRWP